MMGRYVMFAPDAGGNVMSQPDSRPTNILMPTAMVLFHGGQSYSYHPCKVRDCVNSNKETETFVSEGEAKEKGWTQSVVEWACPDCSKTLPAPETGK